MGKHALAAVALALAACGGGGPAWDEGAARAPAVNLSLPRSCARQGRVYLVPIGDLRRIHLDEIVYRYHDEYGLTLEVLSPVAPGADATDATRRQVVAEALAGTLSRSFPAHAQSPEAILIGVTDEDMYIRSYTWRFAFSSRFEGMAVMSTARMDPATFGEPPDSAALHARFYKILTKNIGALYCGFPMSDNPRSVMFGAIMSVEDLDRVDESVW